MPNAAVVFSRGLAAAMPATYQEGRFLLQTDTGALFLDDTASSRIQIKDTTKLSLSGGTMTGPINMNSQKITNLANPTANNDATNKIFVDTAFQTLEAEVNQQLLAYLQIKGGTMTGILDMGDYRITSLATPSADTDAATKGYVDTQISSITPGISQSTADERYLQLTGGTLTGTLSMSNNSITNVATPQQTTDCANKQYVDSGLSQKPNFHSNNWSIGKLVTVAADGSLIAETSLPQQSTSVIPGLIAAYDAPSAVQEIAEFICTSDDCSSIISQAANSYDTIYLSQGTFNISNQIVLDTPVYIIGAGNDATNINCTSDSSLLFAPNQYFKLEGISFTSSYSNKQIVNAVNNYNTVIVSNCSFNNCYIYSQFTQAYSAAQPAIEVLKVFNCNFIESSYGVYFETNTERLLPSISNCYFRSITNYPIYMAGIMSGTYNFNTTVNCSYFIYSEEDIANSIVKGNVVSGRLLYSNASRTSNTITNIIIEGNTTSFSTAAEVYLQGTCNYIIISNNRFLYGPKLRLANNNNSSNITITGNIAATLNIWAGTWSSTYTANQCAITGNVFTDNHWYCALKNSTFVGNSIIETPNTADSEILIEGSGNAVSNNS